MQWFLLNRLGSGDVRILPDRVFKCLLRLFKILLLSHSVPIDCNKAYMYPLLASKARLSECG